MTELQTLASQSLGSQTIIRQAGVIQPELLNHDVLTTEPVADRSGDCMALLENVGDAVLQIDVDDRVTYSNRAARRIFPAIADSQTIWLADLFGRAEAGLLEAACRAARLTGQEAVCELHDVDAGRWLEGRAVPWQHGGIALFLRDVSHSRQTEFALRASERRLAERTRALETSCAALRRLRERAAHVVRELPLELAVVEGYRGGVFRVEEVNLAFCRSWGGTPDGVRGRRVAEVLPSRIASAIELNLARCVAEGGRIEFEGVVAAARPGQGDAAGDAAAEQHRVMHVIMVPLQSEVPGGREGVPRVDHVLVTAVDLSDIRRAEAQLLKAQRVEAIGQLTGGMAHDFNNLLTVILGSLELLERRLGSERERRYLRIAVDAAQRGGMLTQQLLAYARRQHLAPIAVDVNAALTGMADFLRHLLGDRVVLQPKLAGGLWRASADLAQLEQVLHGLTRNAREAMPRGGRLRIETNNAGAGEELPGDLVNGDYVRIALQDNGHGMSPEVLARATEPFFTTKAVGQGSGLGLAQAFGFAKQLGGTVRLFSVESVGTTIELFLPRASPAPVAAPGREPGTGVTVLQMAGVGLAGTPAKSRLERADAPPPRE